ncbi:hypothetical protein TNCV_576681 [Trichonephila clavipes]|nr:hypothetical protein TNCV_576681 [Trichonephila clavipes]
MGKKPTVHPQIKKQSLTFLHTPIPLGRLQQVIQPSSWGFRCVAMVTILACGGIISMRRDTLACFYGPRRFNGEGDGVRKGPKPPLPEKRGTPNGELFFFLLSLLLSILLIPPEHNRVSLSPVMNAEREQDRSRKMLSGGNLSIKYISRRKWMGDAVGNPVSMATRSKWVGGESSVPPLGMQMTWEPKKRITARERMKERGRGQLASLDKNNALREIKLRLSYLQGKSTTMSVIAHQTEKEWISANEKSRQRMSQTQAEGAAKQHAARLEEAHLRAHHSCFTTSERC